MKTHKTRRGKLIWKMLWISFFFCYHTFKEWRSYDSTSPTLYTTIFEVRYSYILLCVQLSIDRTIRLSGQNTIPFRLPLQFNFILVSSKWYDMFHQSPVHITFANEYTELQWWCMLGKRKGKNTKYKLLHTYTSSGTNDCMRVHANTNERIKLQ